MKFLDRGVAASMGMLLLTVAGPAGAQENLYGNKTAAQIFVSDCTTAGCHKSPQGLSKAGGPLGLGLEGFLREHYTASREQAAVMAKYLQSMDGGAPSASDKGAKRGGTGKPAAKKPADAKSDAKSDGKSDAKPAEKPAEAKPTSETKPASDAKPADSKPADAKPE